MTNRNRISLGVGALVLAFLVSLVGLFGQTVTTTREDGTNNPIRKLNIAWTSAADGTATATLGDINGEIVRVVTDPGATAPTDNYDITLTDEDGIDVFAGGGANRDTATSESFGPGIAITVGATTTVWPMAVCGDLALAISNAGDSKQGEIFIYVRQ